MGFRDKIKEQKEELAKRYEKESKEREGGRWGSIIISANIPEGMPLWRPNTGEHLIDVIPFITGPDYPDGEGIIRWWISLWDHTRIGALSDSFVCAAHAFKKPCPIEDFLARNRIEDKTEYNKVKAKQRNIILVWVHDSEEEERKGIQIWYVPDFFFGQKVDEISRRPKGGGIIPFYDLDEGKRIAFRIAEKGKDNIEYAGHRFDDRDGPIPDEIANQSFALDHIIKWKPTYKEIYEAFHASPYLEDGTPVKREIAKGEDPHTREQIVNQQEQSTETITEQSDQQQEVTKEEPPKEQSVASSSACPHNHQFGADIDKFPDHCNGCEKWDDCFDESTRDGSSTSTTTTEEPKKQSRLLRR